MSSKENSREATDKSIESDLKSNSISGAQDEINQYRKANGNTLSSADASHFDETIKNAGFPNLEVVSSSGSSGQSYIVSKDGAQAEQSVMSALGSNPTSSTSIEAANQAVTTLTAKDGSNTALLTNDMTYINAMLTAQGLPQFQEGTNNTWSIADSNAGTTTNTGTTTDGTTGTTGTTGTSTGSDAGSGGGTSGGSSGGGSYEAPSGGGSSGGSSGGGGDANLNVNSGAIAALGTDPGMQAYATQLLEMLGMPVTAANLQFMEAWQKAEGGGSGASDGDAAYNPFNTTEDASGASSINSVGVKSYTSLQSGLEATAQCLENGKYGNILSALKNGTSAMADAQAVAASPWGTGALVEKVLGG